jgi:hypothetical protein
LIISANSENCRVMVIRLDTEIWEVGKGGIKRGDRKTGGGVEEEV